MKLDKCPTCPRSKSKWATFCRHCEYNMRSRSADAKQQDGAVLTPWVSDEFGNLHRQKMGVA